ncbi:GAF domain-containing hybrid sensor histidine kinase/response regulator [Pseudomonas sp. Root562]|uniref:GAF domain-containing hybrid sensor histidine kinase/response regulator n=1 Tax=Pseudomonas sp. Root562 TaxID=1736561 RepID=UPI000703165F|nr:ATP-binding protein [Pseudomonas sp. Root562]KQZ81605.1 histidine kinase [Pseudomonas sp. Root562]
MAIEETLLRQRKVLAKFGELALASDDLEQILDEACRLVGDGLGTNMAKFMLLLEDEITFFVRNGVGWAPNVVGKVKVKACEGTPERHSLDTNGPVISTDIATETRFRYHDFQIENGVKAFVNVLVHGADGERPFGIFEVDSRIPRQFTDSDIDFLRGYSNLLGAALKRSKTMQAMRLTEKKLRESERHYRIAAELNPLWPWTADKNGNLISIDHRWYEYTGLTPEQTLDRQWSNAVHLEDKTALIVLWDQSLTTLQPFDSQIRLRKGTGEYRWFRVRALCSLGIDGHCEQWYGTIEDIDDRVQLENALRDWNELLEDRINQRTQQLEAEQHERAMAELKLRQSQKMEAVGQLTGGIAHDFNNLLAGIIGNLELMQRRIDAGRHDKLARYNSIAMTAASRAAALTQRLLAFSRQQSLNPEIIEPRKVVADFEDMIRRSVGPSIVVGCSFKTSDRIKCDLNQLENALLNLAINARDAMPNGGTLDLSVDRCVIDEASSSEKMMPTGSYVSISVTDSGTGIKPELLSRIFDPFFTTKKIGEGTGLGLSMIYGFTQQSGGQVRVHSSVGVGTTVTLYFPVDNSEPDKTQAHSESGSTEPVGNGETILLVDDEAAVRQMASELLSETGYCVVEAVDSVSAIKQAEKLGHLDLLLTDIGLPGMMNGISLAAELKLKFPQMKVLFITGFAGGSSLISVDATTKVLTKPFSLNELSSRVHALIQVSAADSGAS